MRCEEARLALWPDPRPRPGSADLADALEHYASCLACQRFFDREAALVRRLGRLQEVPARGELRARIAAALDQRPLPRPRRRRWAIGGGIAALAAAAALTLLLTRPPMPPDVARPLVAEARIGLDSQSLTSPDFAAVERWLEDRLGYTVRLPEISDAALVGGRIATLGGVRIPTAVYLVHGMPVSYFALPSGDVMGAPVKSRDVVAMASNGYHIALWSERGLARAVVAPMPRREVVQIAEECQRKAVL